MPSRIEAAQNISDRVRRNKKNWPVPVNYFGGGVYGRIFVTNNGRLMKIQKLNATKEFEILKRLGPVGITPRVRNGNISKVGMGRGNTNIIKALGYIPRGVNTLNMFIMNRVGSMTLKEYYKAHPPTKGYESYIHGYMAWLLNKVGKAGIEHKNLHRENIIVDVDSSGKITRMWLIDFGKSVNLTTPSRNIKSYMKTYRLPYSSPERLPSPRRKTKSLTSLKSLRSPKRSRSI